MPDHLNRTLTAFSAALREHERVAGLDPEMPPETRVWHLLLSALEYCDNREPRLDFNQILHEVREHFVQEHGTGA